MVIFLIILMISIVNAQTQFEEDEFEKRSKQLENLGFIIASDDDPQGITPDDVIISDEGVITITKKGSEKEIDVSKVRGKYKLEMPYGARLTDSSNNKFNFAENNQVNLVHGRIDLNQRLELKEATINGLKIVPENSETFNLENGIIESKKGDVSIFNKNDQFIGKLEGKAELLGSENTIRLFGNDNKVTTFVNKKGTQFEVIGNEGVDIEYNGDLIVSSTNLNHVKILAKDGDYENIFIGPINDKKNNVKSDKKEFDLNLDGLLQNINYNSKRKVGLGEVELVLQKEDKELAILFSEDNLPSVQGAIKGLDTNIGTMIKSGEDYIPFLIYKDEIITNEAIGSISNEDPFSNINRIIDDNFKKLMVRFLVRGGEFDLEKIKESAIKNLQGTNLEEYLIDTLVEKNRIRKIEDSNIVSSLLDIAENNQESLRKVYDGFSDEIHSDFENSGIELLKRIQDQELKSEIVKEYLNTIEKEDRALNPETSRDILGILVDSSLNNQLGDRLKKRTDGLLYPDEFQNLGESEKTKVMQETNFYTSESLSEALDIAQGNQELQVIAIGNMKNKINRGNDLLSLLIATNGNQNAQESILSLFETRPTVGKTMSSKGMKQMLASIMSDWINIREGIQKINPNLISKVMELYSSYYSGSGISEGFEPEKMSIVYSNNHFLSSTKDMDSTERWSIGLSATRLLESEGKEFNDNNLNEAIERIIQLREQNKDRVILGKETETYIPLTHDEKRFSEERMVEMARDAGVSGENIKRGLKGIRKNDEETGKVKVKTIDAIEESKGKTTLHLNGHGTPNHFWFSKGGDGTESVDTPNSYSLSYIEIGNALIQRSINGESISDVTIMMDMCFGYNLAQNLNGYLMEQGIKELPIITTASNRDMVGWGIDPENPSARMVRSDADVRSAYMVGLSRERQSGAPLTMGDVFRAERHFFTRQDSAVFIPQETGLISLGSSLDDVNPNYNPNQGERNIRPVELSQVQNKMKQSFA